MVKIIFKKLIKLTLILISSSTYSQTSCNFSNEEYNTYLCLENYSGYTSSLKSQSLISEILNKIGISDANFILKTCNNTKNATAVFWKNKRYIILDEYYLDSLNKNDQYWFYLFVLSHEIGHHLYGHMFEESNLEQSRNEELQADKFAGVIIRKLGGNIYNIQNALQSINHPKSNNSSHPILTDRLNAAYFGYNSVIEEEKKILDKYKVISDKEYLTYQKSKQIAEARIKGYDFILNNTIDNLNEAIKLYNIAIIDYEDADLYYELSNLYSLKNDFNNAEIYIKKAYQTNRKPEYLIIGWDFCNENNANNCSEYQNIIKTIDYNKITDPNVLKILAKFYTSTQIINTLNNEKLKIAEKLLMISINELENRNNINNQDELLLSDIYNDLSVIYMRQENFKEAYNCINKAISIRENINNILTEINKINEVDLSNYCRLYLNKSIIEIQLEKWEECILTCNKLFKINPYYNSIVNGEIYYFKGRCFHNLKKYNDAILNYNQAIEYSSNNSTYIYYYRGLSKLAIGDEKNSCLDFKIACEKGVESSCNRYKNLCN